LNNAKPNKWSYECYLYPAKVFEIFLVLEKVVKRMSLMGYSICKFPNNLELPLFQVFLLSKISSTNTGRRLVIPNGFFFITNDLQFIDIPRGIGVEDIWFEF